MDRIKKKALRAGVSVAAAVVEHMEKKLDIERFDSISQLGSLCEVCFEALRTRDEGSLLARVVFDLGSVRDVERRGREGQCVLCHKIYTKASENSCSQRLLQRLDSDVKLWRMPSRDIVGERLRVLHIIIDESPVCQILFDFVEAPDNDTSPRTANEDVAYNWFRTRASKSDIDFERLMFWMRDCETCHDVTCNTNMSVFSGVESTSILLIDVLTEQLVELDTKARYLCLSYHWNADISTMFLATRSNVDQLKKTGGLKPYLPKIAQTIRDAMEVVRRVGERYLWVDTLCILQDDEDFIATQINNMHLIYGSSLATIIDLCGNSAHDGLFGVRPGTRSAPCNVFDLGSYRGCCRSADLESTAADHRYESRGWTFQERLLSTRCLVFADNETHFICSAGSFRETLNGELAIGDMTGVLDYDMFRPRGGSRRSNPVVWAYLDLSGEGPDIWESTRKEQEGFYEFSETMKSSSFSQNVLREYFDAVYRETMESSDQESEDGNGEEYDEQNSEVKPEQTAEDYEKATPNEFSPEKEEEYRLVRLFVTYRRLVTEYTRRNLTNRTDILRAFNGITRILSNITDTDFVCGMPCFALDLALLWTPLGVPSVCSKSLAQKATPVTDGPVGSRMPSWSWASTTDQVDFLVPHAWLAYDILEEEEHSRDVVELFPLGARVANWVKSRVGKPVDDSYHPPFKSEVLFLGVQQRDVMQPCVVNSTTSASSSYTTPPTPRHCPSVPSDAIALHLYAQTLPLDAFHAVGGTLISTNALTATSLINTDQNSALQTLMKERTGLNTLETVRRLQPEAPESDLAGNLFYSYEEVDIVELVGMQSGQGQGQGQVEDMSLQLLYLGKVQWFPPSSRHWDTMGRHNKEQKIDVTKRWKHVDELKQWKHWGLTQGEWKTGNVILIRTKSLVKGTGQGMRIAERIGVGHVSVEYWERAVKTRSPEANAWEYVVLE